MLQTIAIVDAYNDPAAEADLGVYDRQYGLPACTSANGCFTVVNQEGKQGPLPPTEGFWAAEISADVQIAHAICQTCRILLVEAKSEEFADLGAAVDAAIAAGATVVNNSYESEGEEASSAAALNAHYNHPGVVITASAGDCGYRGAACPAGGVSFPASSPDVVAVGGTALSETDGVWGSQTWAGTGGGCSSVFAAPLWQTSVSGWARTACATQRLVADIAAVGSTETGVSVYDSTPPFKNGPALGWRYDAGSSVSSPVIAAEFALAGGAHGVRYPAETLYSHVGDGSLYDVTAGSNGACDGATACQAAAGFDGPSGVGSPVGLLAFSTLGSPTNVSVPTVAGSAEQGQILASEPGQWTGSPTSHSYEWARCNSRGEYCQPIAGATESSYTLTGDDVGSRIREQEAAGNGSGMGTPAASAATVPVRPGDPRVRGFAPGSAPTGTIVVVDGTPFSGVSQVRFGGTSARYSVVSPTRIRTTVPDGARIGRIFVTTALGTVASSHNFTPTLSVTGFQPTHGGVGAHVVITGAGFNRTSTVSFGGVSATGVIRISPTVLKVVVPTGVVAGRIVVTNSQAPVGHVMSARSFEPG